ncbi:FtsK/SpoIIIE family DNA translocase [Terricaulis sp.]|uniref:FtsK/SpoIIIE family DNA translocase n=1 Tax=Terricaulis sp. TaxID=2768686 RepID=UPI002AC7A34A|nr:DNA translocase FtsK 4TM domain-containing protein [Terricaulis sp.]MDZ4691061.1 DNA translocase FtsK 4TM domain-containing protein [Terricaulis sp.]
MPPVATSAAARLALKRAAVSVGAAIVGAYGLGAVLTYSPEDPSLNTAANAGTTNLFGGPGAVVADIIVQSLGAAAPLAMAALLAAGALRIYRRQLVARIDKRRVGVCLLGILLLAGAASTIPTPAGWPLATGFGGLFGDWTSGLIAGLASMPGLPFPHVITGILCAIGGLLGIGWSFQVRAQDVRTAAQVARRTVQGSAAATQRAIGYVSEKTRREPEEEQTSQEERRAPRAAERPRPAPRPAPRTPQRTDADAPRQQQRAAPKPEKKQHKHVATSFGEFELPDTDLLSPPKQRVTQTDAQTLHAMSRQLETVLADFGVQGEVLSARPGPVVTLFEFEPAAGVKSSRVIGLSDDIARTMNATAARVAVIPGRNAIGIELPNAKRETVYLRSLLNSSQFAGTQGDLPLALGETIEGDPFAADLTKMPHLLIAGTTGSGKSVGINAMILSLLYKHTPDECRFIMIDPKMLELSVYEGIPHLLHPVVTDPKKAVVALKWTVREMEDRYRRMSKLGVRNITGYNERVRDALERGERLERTVHAGFDPTSGEPIYETRELPLEPMPYIVVVIDEMADLMITAGKEIEAAVQRLAQMARAAGIHVIMATQRPSVDVITGTIKANFPTRISYQVTSKIDSRTILGEQGAEQLLGMGDLLFMAGGGRIRRLHGPFVTDAEVERVVAMLKEQGAPQYRTDVTQEPNENAGADDNPELFADGEGGGDDLFDRAVEIVQRDRKASTSYLQRRLSIGYNRAATLIEKMEKAGIISEANAAGKRDILVDVVDED